MSYRKIDINGQTWTYKVGRSNVHLKSPNGKGQVIEDRQIGQLDPWEVRPRQWKVTPADIKSWVERGCTTTAQTAK